MKIESGYLIIAIAIIIALLPMSLGKTDNFYNYTVMTIPNASTNHDFNGVYNFVDNEKCIDGSWATMGYFAGSDYGDLIIDYNLTLMYEPYNLSTIINSINYTFKYFIDDKSYFNVSYLNATTNGWIQVFGDYQTGGAGGTTKFQTINFTKDKLYSNKSLIINITMHAGGAGGDAQYFESNVTILNDAQEVNVTSWAEKNNTLVGETINFTMQINSSLPINFANATFRFNGTEYAYTTIENSSTQANFTKTLVIPLISNIVSLPYNWTYYINGYNNISNTETITVNPLGVSIGSTCTAGLTVSYNFSFYDEVNLTSLSNNVNYNIKYGITNNTQYQVYGNLSSIQSFVLCINASVYNNYSIGYGEIEYLRDDFKTRKYYLFTGQRATNITSNIYLYNIEDAVPTTFYFTAKDYLLNPYNNYYLALLRWYPSNNTYKIVEMGKTNSDGTTVMYPVENTVDYRVALYSQDGTLIKLGTPTKMVCTSSPCTYNIVVLGEASDYTSILGIQSSMTINTNTNLITFTWNDPSQATDQMRFEVYKDSGYTTIEICNTSLDNYVGVLTCDVSAHNGTIIAKGYRTASPEQPIILRIFNLGSYLNRQIALFIQIVISLLAASMALWSPIAAILFTILSLGFGLVFRLFSWEVVIGAGILGFVVLHFISRSQAK